MFLSMAGHQEVGEWCSQEILMPRDSFVDTGLSCQQNGPDSTALVEPY